LTHNRFFIAGDEDQFVEYLAEHACEHVSLQTLPVFRHIFHKLKKGIFVAVRDGKLRVFLPFVKANYVNNFSSFLTFPGKFGNSMRTLHQFVSLYQDYAATATAAKVACSLSWYGGGNTLRYTVDARERLTNVSTLYDLIQRTIDERVVPENCDFFINRRDHPLIRRDGSEPYAYYPPPSPARNNVTPLSEKEAVVFSMSTTTDDAFCDVLMPTYDDWIVANPGNTFEHARLAGDIVDYVNNQTTEAIVDEWSRKKNIAVFRGSNTGNVNRLRLMEVFQRHNDNDSCLDVGLSSIRMRPQLTHARVGEFTVPVYDTLEAYLRPPISMKVQAQTFKYVIHIAGHVEAFRLTCELGYGSVILLVDNEWTSYAKRGLIPFVHYVPVESDLSDLLSRIHYLQDNDAVAQRIAINAFDFFSQNLRRDSILDGMARALRENAFVIGNHGGSNGSSVFTDYQLNVNKIAGAFLDDGANFVDAFSDDDLERYAFEKTFHFETDASKITETCFSLAVFETVFSDVWWKCTRDERSLTIRYEKYNMTLAEYLKDDALFSFRDCCQSAIIPVLEEIKAFQGSSSSHGVIHMDLTPWNVLVNVDAHTRRIVGVKIIDFGKAYVKQWNACLVAGCPDREAPFARDVSVFVSCVVHDILKYRGHDRSLKAVMTTCVTLISRFFPSIPTDGTIIDLQRSLGVLKKMSSAGFSNLHMLAYHDDDDVSTNDRLCELIAFLKSTPL
jgi:hypothetical protein